MKKKIYFIINILMSIIIYVMNTFYQYYHFNFTLKCITSGLFAILAIVNLTYLYKEKITKNDLKYPLFMVLGSIFCFLGDAFINHYFVPGVILFALGHMFYVIAYCNLFKLRKMDFIIGGSIGICAAVFVAFFPLLEFSEPILKIACVIYALILSFMLGKTISNFIKEKSKLNLYLLIGAALFFISDLMLLLNWFMNAPYFTKNICMGTYVPANVIFAYTIYYYLDFKVGD